MENCSFQTQLVSIMEILAKAALAEINRRVDDSCAVLRLEITQSQQDINILKKKCDSLEMELRRTKLRTRRKGFYPPATERYPPLVKILLNKERDAPVWCRQMSAEEDTQASQGADMDRAGETEPILIKEETADEDMWKSNIQGELASGTGQTACFEDTAAVQTEGFAEHYSSDPSADPGSVLPPAGGYSPFPEQPANEVPDSMELLVKHEQEEEPEKNSSLMGSNPRFVMDEAARQLWPTNTDRDASEPNFPYAAEQYQQNTPVFALSHSLAHSVPEDTESLSAGKSQSNLVSSARAKRRARMFAGKRAQTVHMPEAGHGVLAQINSLGESSLLPQPIQHQYPDTESDTGGGEGLGSSSLVAPSFSGYSRSNTFGLVRRMRTPWRPGVGEKRFSCTYCTKSFMRFSQLKEHLRSHTGEKPFSCLQCGRSFTKQCNLIRHAVVHSGEKPYQCAQCGKCFTQRSSLKSHQKTAH